jgi:chromosome segregation ATPase
MNPLQSAKQELEASIRYCENAMSSAKQTIESMKKYQQQTGREEALERELADMTGERNARAKRIVELKQEVKDLKVENTKLNDRLMISMKEVGQLQSEVDELEHAYNNMKQYADRLLDENVGVGEGNEELKTNMALMTDELEELRGIIDRMGDDSTGDSVTIKQLREQVGELKSDGAILAERIDEMKATAFADANTIKHLRDRRRADANTITQLQSEVDELETAYKNECHETQVYKKAWREQREIVALRDDQIAMLERRLAKQTGEKAYPFKEGDIYYVFNGLDGTWIESVWDDESERIHDSPNIPSRPHRVYFTVDQKHVLDQFKPEDVNE